MSKSAFISMAVIRRLPRYYRYIHRLWLDGVTRISSRELADRMELTASQVRQDFNCFGEFGQQGCGYDVALLNTEIAKILGLNEGYRVIMMGAGRLGSSIIENFNFESRGFHLAAVFDSDPNKIGTEIDGLKINDPADLEGLCGGRECPEIGVLCVPREVARECALALKKAGVKAIWNFTSENLYDLGLVVENVHISDSILTLGYRLNELERELYG
ncbi:MAG: redox-sensing transcriptional repressor Rex [Clostridia bacterium]|nr:redox-sensing transcriptional repressor Rex [Clostridia bacterium]